MNTLVLHYTLATDKPRYTELHARADDDTQPLHSVSGTWSRAYMLEYFVGLIRHYRPEKVAVQIGNNEPQLISKKTVMKLLEGRDPKEFLI